MKKFLILMIGVSITTQFALADSGILFLAHGSMKKHLIEKKCDNHKPSIWEKEVLNSVQVIKTKLPHNSEVAFGMWNTKCFNNGVKRLQKAMKEKGKELDHLIVFPIFISSYSAVIEMQKFIFKKRPDRIIPLPWVKRISFKGKISYLQAIDYNPYVSIILSNRFHQLIHLAKSKGYTAEQMELVFVMHGPVSEKNNKKWLSMADKYVADMTYLFPMDVVHTISLRDDAPKEIRNRATKKLQMAVVKASEKGKIALILPLLLSKGGIEEGILKRLNNLDYIWTGNMLLPDPNLSKLLVNKLQEI